MSQTPSLLPRRSVLLACARTLLATAPVLTMLAIFATILVGIGHGRNPAWLNVLTAGGVWLGQGAVAIGILGVVVLPFAFAFNVLYLWLLGAAILLVLWLPFGLLRLGRHHLRKRSDEQ